MKTLALEFSTEARSVAVWSPGDPAGTITEVTHRRGRATPAFALIQEALAQARLHRPDIERLAVGLGPGSATGIRTAIALAQGWQLARGIQVVGRNSLVTLAAGLQAAGHRGEWHLAVDAQRQEYHLMTFTLTPQGWHESKPLRLATAAELRDLIAAGCQVAGPNLATAFPKAVNAFPAAGTLASLTALAADSIAAERLEPLHLRQPDFVKSPGVLNDKMSKVIRRRV